MTKHHDTKEKEPAPVVAETSSEVVMKNDQNIISHSNDNTRLKICQEALERTRTDMLMIYDDMSPEEQRAFDLGEIFSNIVRALVDSV